MKKILAFVFASALAAIVLIGGSETAFAICTKEYVPVCGVKKGVRMTFGNACEAREAGAAMLHPGPCIALGPNPVCLMIYMPVCAVPPGKRYPTTYSNLCVAEVANARFVRNGTCR